MIAFSLSLALLLYWSLLGFALSSGLGLGRAGLQRVLLSPSLGLAALLLPVFFLSRAGLPVGTFALPLVGCLALLAAVSLAWRLPRVPWCELRVPGILLLGALVLTGWPMGRFGLDWISYGNDDMANYALAAQRFLQHGYTDLPDLPTYLSGKNYSLAYWYMHVAAGARPGSELMLATVWGVTGLNGHQIFMPTILALHLALIASSAAAVAGVTGVMGVMGLTGAEVRRRRRLAVYLTMGWMVFSPLSTLGTLYQLIAQVGGMGMMMAALALLCQPASTRWRRETAQHVGIGLLVAGLLIWYPEVLPFLLLGWLGWCGAAAWRAARAGTPAATLQRMWLTALALACLILVFNRYLLIVLRFMLGQSVQGLETNDPSALYFPFYLIPSGIGYFWGLLPIGFLVPEPWMSTAIVAGMALCAWLLVCIFRQLRHASPVGFMAMAMLLLGGILFFRGNDFGLYKLAMYMQPAVAGVIACALASAPRRTIVAVVSLIGLAQIPSQFAYVLRSTGNTAGTLTEIPYASQNALARQFDAFMKAQQGAHPEGFYSDSSNVVLAKIQSLYAQNSSLIFPSKEYYWGGDRLGEFARANGYGEFWNKSLEAHATYAARRQIALANGLTNQFILPQAAASLQGRALLANSPEFSLFNRFGQPVSPGSFRIETQPRNHLIFVDSSLGAHYYLARKRKNAIAFFQMEADPMFPGRQMAGVGRHMLLLAMGVTDRPRLLIELTDSVLRQQDSALPAPIIYGQGQQAVRFVGRGSGRILSEPLEPVMVNGLAFFHLDMGRDGLQFPHPPTNLITGLYGRDVALDSRYLTAFARDVSLISEEQAAAMVPPAALSRFPADLAHEGLQYSGIYEDGWVSEQAFAVLAPADATVANTLTLRGTIPLISDPGFRCELTLRVDGQIVARRTLGLGDYEVKAKINAGSGGRRIELAFDSWQILPGGDSRPTSGLIKYIGLTKD
jgi:hypothetical protein